MSLKTVKILSIFAVFCMVFVCLTGCEDTNKAKQQNTLDNKQIRDSLEIMNKRFVAMEKEAIKNYIGNSGHDFVETGTGLCYRIVNQGDGEPIKRGNIVALDYKMSLLNGDLIYSSDESGKKVFVVGHGGVESGLEEAMLYLNKGDEAEIIIPSRLAHGLLGDGKKIPPRATIVYELKVIENQVNK